MSGYVEDELARERARAPGAEVWRGLIASSPADATVKVMVTIPAFAPDLQFGPCRWTPRVESHDYSITGGSFTAARVLLPVRGDACLVAFDENHEPWVVLYVPAAYA